jgi:hypothetical protein
MATNFTRRNSELERRIAEVAARPGTTALDLQNLLAETNALEVIQGGAPEPQHPSTVGRRLSATVQGPDGQMVTVHADSFYGLDILAKGVREGRITQDI